MSAIRLSLLPLASVDICTESLPCRMQAKSQKQLGKGTKFVWAIVVIALFYLTGCGGREQPTRTPVPTWTPTPLSAGAPASNGQANRSNESSVGIVSNQNNSGDQFAVTSTPTLIPPTATPLPTATPIPTSTPTITPTPLPTATPTDTPLPTPTPTPAYSFELQSAEKFPTESLAVNVVRVFLYTYSATDFALPGYSLRVLHNGTPLAVNALSSGGLPERTKDAPSPYTRFTNMNAIFIEPQAGTWVIELIDANGVVVGPPAIFELTAEENTREFYLRYRLK